MKKRIIAIALCIAALVTFAVAAAACEEEKTTAQLLEERVSDRQTALYTGQTENAYVTIGTLDREKVFVTDGEAGELETVTTVIASLPSMSDESTYAYVLEGESGKVEGTMTPSVIGAKLIAKIADASALGALVKLTITDSAAPDAPFTFELTDKMADAIAPGEKARSTPSLRRRTGCTARSTSASSTVRPTATASTIGMCLSPRTEATT